MGTHARGRLSVVVALALSSLAVHAIQDPAGPEKGTGFIAGRVVDASTNQPVARMLVSVSGGDAPVVMMTASGTMMTAPGAQARQILTDTEGRFVVRDLAKGRYQVRASSPGYVAGAYGQTRPNGPNAFIDLPEHDSKVGDVLVRVWKTSSITGTVVDESGEPVVGVAVTSLRRTMAGGQPRLSTSFGSATDDRGMYRIANMVPGDYLVGVVTGHTTMPASTVDAMGQIAAAGAGITTSALYRELSASGIAAIGMAGHRVGDFLLASGDSGRSGGAMPVAPDENQVLVYPTTFYPAALSPSHAAVISLESGAERLGVDIHLKLAPSVRVSGTVTGPDGPAGHVGVRLLPAHFESFTGTLQSTLGGGTAATDAAGAFTFLGITPGQYTLKVMRVPRPALGPPGTAVPALEISGPAGGMVFPGLMAPMMPAPPPLPEEPSLWASMPVAVGEDGVTGVAVTLRPGARVNGTVKFDGSQAPEPAQMQRTSVQFLSNEPRFVGLPLPLSRIDENGRFQTTGYPPGRYQVMAAVPPMPNASWFFKSAVLNGRNLDDGLEIEGEDLEGIVITFSDRPTSLSGSVVDARGQPDTAADVVMFPADSQAWRQGIPNTRRVRTTRTSSTGQYDVANVPEGDYYVVALASGANVEMQDPAFLESVIGQSTRVRIADGEKKVQPLTSKAVR